jgi:hypothetical protein
MSKSCPEVVKKLSKKLSKSCQKKNKKLSKNIITPGQFFLKGHGAIVEKVQWCKKKKKISRN